MNNLRNLLIVATAASLLGAPLAFAQQGTSVTGGGDSKSMQSTTGSNGNMMKSDGMKSGAMKSDEMKSDMKSGEMKSDKKM